MARTPAGARPRWRSRCEAAARGRLGSGRLALVGHPPRSRAPRRARRSSSSRSRASAGRSAPGRDLESYLAVYVDFWHARRGLPVGDALADAGGAARRRRHPRPRQPGARRAFAALLFAGSVLLYARTALLFGRGPAVLVAVALLLYPGYGVALPRARERDRLRGGVRRLDGDRRARARSVRPIARFALLGVATGLHRARRARRTRCSSSSPSCRSCSRRPGASGSGGRSPSSASPSRCSAPGRRSNLVALRRLRRRARRQASLPLFRAFIVDHIVEPDNGPASRSSPPPSSGTCSTEEPYRSYGIDLATFFARGQPADARGPRSSLSDRL